MSPLLIDLLYLVGGFAVAALGGELFVRGLIGIARSFRMPPAVVGATVAAFGTSSPELAVAVTAALEGVPAITFGNIAGANVANLGLIVGMVLLARAMEVAPQTIRRDFSFAALTPLITAALIADGAFSRLDAGILLAAFALWMGMCVRAAVKDRGDDDADDDGRQTPLGIAAYTLSGLAALLVAGELVVSGATGIGAALGLDPFVVGSTLVAIGTTMPEFATVVAARIRGHDEVGLGTALGSIVFNGLFIVAVAGLIRPFEANLAAVGAALAMGLLTVVAAAPLRGTIPRWRGIALLGLYASHVMVQLVAGSTGGPG
jgi:cation:H+ antiporter